jgi:hypothetical protein
MSTTETRREPAQRSITFDMDQRTFNRLTVNAMKREPCADCGNCYEPDAMDFDHVRGTKLANISDLIAGPTDRLRTELEKCELVCAVCHRLRGLERRLDQTVDRALDAAVDELLLELDE